MQYLRGKMMVDPNPDRTRLGCLQLARSGNPCQSAIDADLLIARLTAEITDLRNALSRWHLFAGGFIRTPHETHQLKALKDRDPPITQVCEYCDFADIHATCTCDAQSAASGRRECGHGKRRPDCENCQSELEELAADDQRQMQDPWEHDEDCPVYRQCTGECSCDARQQQT